MMNLHLLYMFMEILFPIPQDSGKKLALSVGVCSLHNKKASAELDVTPATTIMNRSVACIMADKSTLTLLPFPLQGLRKEHTGLYLLPFYYLELLAAISTLKILR